MHWGVFAISAAHPVIYENWKKQNYKFYDVSFILSHSNKGIKHSGDFDKKIKREYLGRIIDNVDFFFMNSHVHILFSSTVMCGFYFSSTVA
jgi:hypothetical protein